MINENQNLNHGFGLQFFPDTEHTSESDCIRWFPILKALNIQWLVINAGIKRAIPEPFLRGLIEIGISPIIRFQLSMVDNPWINELEPFLSAYGKWGVQFASFYEKPNQSTSWKPDAWVQPDLVERFVDRFLSLAKPALSHQIRPIFPILFPGGNYWDTLFFEQALVSLKRRKEFDLLKQMVLSAYGWTFNHPLNWGRGGPTQWPAARPYSPTDGIEDHRGFQISDWYFSISQNILEWNLPVFLFESGLPGPIENVDLDLENLIHVYQQIIEQSEKSYLEVQTNEGKEKINQSSFPTILFSLLSSEVSHSLNKIAWFNPDGSITPLGEKMRCMLPKPLEIKGSPHLGFSKDLMDTYLLLPSFEWGVADWHLDMIRPFVKKNRPSLGFSLKDACHAKKVIVIGGEDDFPDDDLITLRSHGCLVERIQGDGTSIATQLAER
jgi:hypothetical protein